MCTHPPGKLAIVNASHILEFKTDAHVYTQLA